MAQYIKNANIFGRLGSGIGQGLADQIPKEVERSRLSSGLQAFEQEHGTLNPIQQLARLSSIPGITPQMIQSFSDLARQQGMAKSLEKSNTPEQNPYAQNFFGGQSPAASPQESQVPSITSGGLVSQNQKGYIQPTTAERDAMGAQVFTANPARFQNDPNKALAYVDKEVEIQKDRDLERQKLAERQQGIQDNVVSRLKQQSGNLGVQIPSNIYSAIEDEAIRSVLPTDQGGGGRSEQQAIKEYGKKLDEVSRDYKDLDAMSGAALIGNKSGESLRSINSLQKRFKSRNDTENFADILMSKNNISPMMSYAIADKVSDFPDLNKAINRIPVRKDINESLGLTRFGVTLPLFTDYQAKEKTREISPGLMKAMGQDGSPLAVAYELEKKGYDPQEWLNYLNEHEKEWNPTVKQLRQTSKPQPLVRGLSDYWMSSFTGME